MTTISATTVLRSRHAEAPGQILSTLLLRYPRWIHAEGRTHRLLDICEDLSIEQKTPSLMDCDELSRNAASFRAIPVLKMIEDVERNPAVPLFWGKNVAGMQANEELTGAALQRAEDTWFNAMRDAINRAREMANLFPEDTINPVIGAHKQIVNRLLEPFSHITVLVSATEWDNFLELRDHEDAEPHIQMLAREIKKCLDDHSTVQTLKPGDWHMPFITLSDKIDVEDTKGAIEALKALSVARCASTSYKTVDGFDMTLAKALQIFDKLVNSKPIHASPLEHVAQADDMVKLCSMGKGWMAPRAHGNFVGFKQYRHLLN